MERISLEKAGYNDSVFINCPFDEPYNPMLQAIIYAVYRCGFFPKTALDEDNGMENRLNKIIHIIKDCRYGIHDISRIELTVARLPRFNMPFELGMFFGAKYLGTGIQKTKNALVFERTKYTYLQYISDLNGIDTKAHNSDPVSAIRSIRDWLSTASGRKSIPGHKVIDTEYLEFMNNLPSIVEALGFETNNIPFTEYRTIVEEAVREKLG